MPGGRIEVSMDDAFRIVMTGPVTRVAEGNLSREIFVSEPTQPVHGEYPGSLLDP
jgi:hypothetical protein